MWRAWRWFVVLACLQLVALGAAKVIQDDSPGTIIRTENYLDAFADRLGFPRLPVAAGNAIAVVRVEGPGYSLTVVGPPDANALTYAETLDRWRASQNLPGNVSYGTSENAVWARWSMLSPRWGAMRFDKPLPLRSMSVAVRGLEQNTRMGLFLISGTQVSLEPAQGLKTRSQSTVWDLSDSKGPDPTITVEISPSLVFMTWGWLLWLPVSALVWVAIAWRVATHSAKEIADRRVSLKKVSYWGTGISIGTYTVATFVLLPSGAMNALCLAWIGQRFTSIAIPFVVVGFVIFLGFFTILTRLESKLLAPSTERSPEDLALQAAIEQAQLEFASDIEAAKRRAKLGLPITFGGVAISVSVMAFDLMPNEAVFIPIIIMIVIIYVIDPVLKRLIPDKPKVENAVLRAELDDKLQHVLAQVAHVTGKRLTASVCNPYQLGTFNCLLTRPDHLDVAADAVSVLEEDELKFLMTAATVQQEESKLKSWLVEIMFWVISAVLITLAVFSEQGAFVLAAIAILMLARFIDTKKHSLRNLQRKSGADRAATVLLGDKELALRTLEIVLPRQWHNPILSDVSANSPDFQARIEAVRSIPDAELHPPRKTSN